MRKLYVGIASIAVVLTAAIAAIAFQTAFRGGLSVHSDLVVATDVQSLARMSQVIVVGTVTSEAGTRNLARNPSDPAKEDLTRKVIAQDYAFSVQETLKGVTGPAIVVTSARSGSIAGPNGQTGEYKDESFVPLTVGGRYLLLLRSLPWEPGVYALAFEPSRFELGAGATVRSTWRDAQTYFPVISTDLFISTLRAAVSANSAIQSPQAPRPQQPSNPTPGTRTASP